MKKFTIRQIANREGVSKPAIQSRMKNIKNFRQKYCSRLSGSKTLLINQIGADKLHKNSNKEFIGKLSAKDAVSQLTNQNEYLRHQLNQVTNALDHEQVLHLQDNKQANSHIKQLQEQNNTFQRQLSYHKNKPSKRGFWSRLFGRK